LSLEGIILTWYLGKATVILIKTTGDFSSAFFQIAKNGNVFVEL
jgi:hypothetical protein